MAGAIFYSLVVGCCVLGVSVREYYLIQKGDSFDAFYDSFWWPAYLLIDAALKLVSAFLIVFSHCKFNKLIKAMRSKDFFANEKPMFVNLLIFLLYMSGNFGYYVVVTIENQQIPD